MPISATGRRNRCACLTGGFTLLEVMVVVAIVGIILLVVHPRAPDRAAAALKLEADRLLGILNDCHETAVLSGRPAGVRVAAHGYALERYRRGWEQVAAATDTAGSSLPEEIDLVATARASANEQPAVVCLPSGETIAAPLELHHRAARGHFRVRDDSDRGFVAEWIAPPA